MLMRCEAKSLTFRGNLFVSFSIWVFEVAFSGAFRKLCPAVLASRYRYGDPASRALASGRDEMAVSQCRRLGNILLDGTGDSTRLGVCSCRTWYSGFAPLLFFPVVFAFFYRV